MAPLIPRLAGQRGGIAGRLLAGCGCLVLLALVAGGLALWKGEGFFRKTARELVAQAGKSLEDVVNSTGAKAEEIFDRRWKELSADLEALQTDSGARRLWEANPSLSKHFGSEEEFLSRVRTWRPKLEAMGGDLPDWKRADPRIQTVHTDGKRGVELSFTNRRGSRVRLLFEGTQLAYIEVQ